jgi:hypothetical protein
MGISAFLKLVFVDSRSADYESCERWNESGEITTSSCLREGPAVARGG